MATIIMICENPTDALVAGIKAHGKLWFYRRDRFFFALEDLKKKRDADLLITALPPVRGYYEPTVSALRAALEELRIPVVVYTSADLRVFSQLFGVPVFCLQRVGYDETAGQLVSVVEGVAKTWFPLTVDQRKEFMDSLIADYAEAAKNFPGAHEILLCRRFGVYSDMQAAQALERTNELRKLMGQQPIASI